jgi:hypothetical protein
VFRAVLRLSWHSSATSAISDIAPPPLSKFRFARCHQGLNPSPKTHYLHRIFCSKPPIETSPPLDRSSHTGLSCTKIAAIRRCMRRLKILPAITPCHVPHAPSTLPLPRVTLSLRHVSPISTSALVLVSATSSPRQPVDQALTI